jgi:hypothetical protein
VEAIIILQPIWAKVLSVMALVLALTAGVYAYGFLPVIDVWVNVWTFFLFLAVLLFVLLSTVAIGKGRSELFSMLRRLLR